MKDGRQDGVESFFVAGDQNLELGFLCMSEDEDTNCTYGPQCWHGVETNLVV